MKIGFVGMIMMAALANISYVATRIIGVILVRGKVNPSLLNWRVAHYSGLSYILEDLTENGDNLKKIILMLALSFIAICYPALAGSDVLKVQAAEDVLIGDSGGNISEMNITLSTMNFFNVAAAVKFEPPKSSWALEKIQIVGNCEYVDDETIPAEKIICIEIRDKDLNLLYQFADSQLAYFTPNPTLVEIEVPAMKVNGDFYICIYNRGAIYLGTELGDPKGNSYYFERNNKEVIEADLPVGDSEERFPVNWLIRAVGS